MSTLLPEGHPMPNRIIRESCRSSETLALLSHGAERMFWRLTTVADDSGRFQAAPKILLADCFKVMADRVRPAHVAAWLEELARADLVRLYEANGKQYGFFVTWASHQRPRASTSKYPEPPSGGDSPTSAATCGDLPQLAAGCGDSRTSADIRGSRARGCARGRAVSRESLVVSRDSRILQQQVPLPPPPKGLVNLEAEIAWGDAGSLMQLYNKASPEECPAVETASLARLAKERLYLKQFPDEAWWQDVCRQMRESRFLRGLKNRPGGGHEKWVADFDWLLSRNKGGQVENCVRVHDGVYRD